MTATSLSAVWRSETALVVATLVVVLASLQVIFGPYLPVDGAYLGHDYSAYLPNLLTGYYWFLNNGLFAVPWFNPAQCGGFPFFPDFNSLYYTLPQFLSFWISPLAAIRFSFLALAGAGFVGFVLLLRRRFGTSLPAALAGGVFFAFNGFFVYRFLIGHLNFHAFALMPLLALFVLPGVKEGQHQGRWHDLGGALLAGLILTLMIQGSMVHALPPTAFAVAGILLIHGWLFGRSYVSWLRFLAAVAVFVSWNPALLTTLASTSTSAKRDAGLC